MSVIIDRVSKSFGTKTVLDSASLTLQQGQTHVLLGSSGSGKSTLLRIILGLLSAESGTIEINGRQMRAGDRSEWVQSIGYVPQEGGLFPHLTARQNVSLVAQTLSWPQAKIKERAEELLSVVSLDADLLDQYPRQLSGGQRQRVALMRAVFLNPELIVMDEPLGALDPLIRADLQAELREVFRRLGKTVILVTHDIGEAAFFGETITLLKDGQILQTGSFRDLMTAPAHPFVTRFIRAQRSELEMESGS